MKRFFHNNGLSLVLLGAFFITLLFGQFLVGHQQYNNEQQEHGQPTATYLEYLEGNHFLEATMENWESEFLQMFFFIVLTVFLYQKGSAESKHPDKKEDVDRDPRKSRNKKDAPWPVRRGGWILKVYEHSLSLAFLLLFLGTFFLHAVGGAGEYNDDQRAHGRAVRVTTLGYMTTSQFWFESLQNWQSEFLAVGSMVVLTIFLREKGSKESKPVDAPHHETAS
jgi:Na+/H+ antiporter NhaD/arsenite permease-like protein